MSPQRHSVAQKMALDARPRTHRRKRGRPTTGSLSFRKSKAGVWSATVRWQVNGKRRERVVARGKNRNQLELIASAELARLHNMWETDHYEELADAYKTWTDATSEFLAWCAVHIEASSTKRYRAVLDNWAAAGLHPALLEDTRGMEFELYKSMRLAGGSMPSGVNYEIRTLRRFWNWCQQPPRQWVRHWPFEGVGTLRTDYGPDVTPRIFTADECVLLRERSPDYAADAFTFAIDTGLRLGELMFLDPTDIDFTNSFVRVVAKDGHRIKHKAPRSVPLTERAWGIAEKSMEARPAGPLFMGPRSMGDRWGKMGPILNLWIKKVAPDASIKTARATFISYALRDTGGDLMAVMAWAGHSNIETTKRYLAAVPQNQKAAIDSVEFP